MQPNIPTTPQYFSQFRNTSQQMKNWRILVRQFHFPLKGNHQWCSPFLLHISSGFFDSEQTKPLRSLYRKSRKWSSSPFPNNFTNLYRLYNFELVTGIFHEHFSVDIMGDKRKSTFFTILSFSSSIWVLQTERELYHHLVLVLVLPQDVRLAVILAHFLLSLGDLRPWRMERLQLYAPQYSL